jgi:hypothetical protein
LLPWHEYECTGYEEYVEDIDVTDELIEDHKKHGEGKPLNEEWALNPILLGFASGGRVKSDSVLLDVEAVAADPIEAGEGGVELFAEILLEAEAVSLNEATWCRATIVSVPHSTADAAPVQTAPQPVSSHRLLHQCKPQCLHRTSRQRSTPCTQGGRYRTVTFLPSMQMDPQ